MKACNITLHAVDQFISRFEPSKNRREAEEELQALYRTSRKVGKTPLGDQIVVSSYRTQVRLVIKDLNVCVTVLPPPRNSKSIDILSDDDYNYLNEFESHKKIIIEEIQIQMEDYEKEYDKIAEEVKKLNDRKSIIKCWIQSKTRELEVLGFKKEKEDKNEQQEDSAGRS